VYDWENDWAIKGFAGYNAQRRDYQAVCEQYHAPFWKRGIPTDVISMEQDFSPYKLVIAPMLYMLKPHTAARIADYVQNGGCFVGTYLTGIVNENDLCYLGGVPAEGLREVFGVWAEETDALHDGEVNVFSYGGSTYEARHICDLLHAESATVLGTFESDFYAGYPAVTRHAYGRGAAYYVAPRGDDRFIDRFCGDLIESRKPRRSINIDLPEGVSAQRRGEQVFLMNFRPEETAVMLDRAYRDLLSDATVCGKTVLPPFGCLILR
jgi:beta-galactosidase